MRQSTLLPDEPKTLVNVNNELFGQSISEKGHDFRIEICGGV
jgi:hypothetical protein